MVATPDLGQVRSLVAVSYFRQASELAALRTWVFELLKRKVIGTGRADWRALGYNLPFERLELWARGSQAAEQKQTSHVKIREGSLEPVRTGTQSAFLARSGSNARKGVRKMSGLSLINLPQPLLMQPMTDSSYRSFQYGQRVTCSLFGLLNRQGKQRIRKQFKHQPIRHPYPQLRSLIAKLTRQG
jgi:hypothetical protein